ncbi:hypothetical protein D3C80_1827280 [compost metagenome]
MLILLSVTQQHHARVEEAPEPAAFHAHFEYQRVIGVQRRFGLEHAVLQADQRLLSLIAKTVGVILTGRVEQVIGEPGFMGRPEHRQQQQG